MDSLSCSLSSGWAGYDYDIRLRLKRLRSTLCPESDADDGVDAQDGERVGVQELAEADREAGEAVEGLCKGLPLTRDFPF